MVSLLSERRFALEIKHLKILLFSAIVLSASILGTTAILRSRSGASRSGETKTGENHFSVIWRGFIPDYDPSYPDYYICINDLIGTTLTMDIRLFIQNQEASGYYFKIKSCGAPSGWFVPEHLIGYIDVDATKDFVYQMDRSKPAFPEGRLTESVCLNVSAHYDAFYSEPAYSWDSFDVTFHFLNRTSEEWTLIYYNSFDDGTAQGWAGGTPITDYYRSFRYSLRGGTVYKSFYTGAEYTESYAVFAARSSSVNENYPQIYLDGTLYFKPDAAATANVWYQFAAPLHLGTTEIRIVQPYYWYMDDVYVIAK